MIKITAPNALFQTDSAFFPYVTWAAIYGYKAVAIGGDISEMHLPTDGSFTIAQMFQVVAATGEVEGYPTFIEMTAAKKAGNVPVGISGRLAVDDEGNETVRTWIDWATAHGRTWRAKGTKHYIEGSNGTTYLKGSELAVLTTGYSVVTKAAYNAKLTVSNAP